MSSVQEATKKEKKRHAVVVSLPGQGHVNPMLTLAKMLHSRGFHITFVNCNIFVQGVLLSKGPDALRPLDGFQFRTIADGIDLSSPRSPAFVCSSAQRNCAGPFRDLMVELNSSGDLPVSHIVTDGMMTCTMEVARELQIPVAVFWPMNAASLVGFLHTKELVEKGMVPVKDESELKTPVNWIPGMNDIHLKGLSSFIRTTNPDDITMLEFCNLEAKRTSMAPTLILNTVDELERGVLDALASTIPHIYPIGPLSLLSNRVVPQESHVLSINLDYWEKDSNCLAWLESKPFASVVYVNFGSVTRLTISQLVEFAQALARSKYYFLWVLRSNIVSNGTENPCGFLPKEIMEDIKDKGLITSWCSQEHVLSHSSIGAFLTHNGWNSTIENMSYGVPMICWPYFADQQTNCYYVCDQWGIGVEIPNDVESEQVEKLIREVMEGEKGQNMRKRALHWKNSLTMAVTNDGSGSNNFERLLNEVLI